LAAVEVVVGGVDDVHSIESEIATFDLYQECRA
jgi:hypothetical protein